MTALAGAALVAAVGLGLVALRVHDVQLAYRIDALRAEHARTTKLIRELEIEIATLGAPGRLESRARQLGMTPPALDQVRLAREYVPTATGRAAAQVVGNEAMVR